MTLTESAVILVCGARDGRAHHSTTRTGVLVMHGIEKEDKVAIVGSTGWHGLGINVPETMSVEEALNTYLGWTVVLEPVYGKVGDRFIPIKGHQVVCREDIDTSSRFLGIVGENYLPLQNSEFKEDIKALVGESGAKLSSIGSLRGGRLVWVLLKLTEDSLIKSDQFYNYLLLASSHDGSAAKTVRHTPIRVVCFNTYSAATRGKADIYVKHTTNAQDRIKEARRIIGQTKISLAKFAEVYNRLAEIQVSDTFSEFFARKMFDIKMDAKEEDISRRKYKMYETFVSILNNPKGGRTRAIWRTAFGLYNAVTEFVDYHRSTRLTEDSEFEDKDAARYSSSLFGSGRIWRDKALEFLTDDRVQQLCSADSPTDLVESSSSILDGIEVASRLN